MKVRNVHERVVTATLAQAREIVNTYGSVKDRMYPFERWPKMQLEGPDGPPAVGRFGTRGAARFVITTFDTEPYIHYAWRFLQPAGFDGMHDGTVEDLGDGRLRFRSVIEMHTRGLKATLLWLFVMRPLHDAVVEDSFDKVEREMGRSLPDRPLSFWVRTLRRIKRRRSAEYQRIHREQLDH